MSTRHLVGRVRALVRAITRISLGWVFLWAFLDKAFGLGRATPAENAWLDGGSPTNGFLANAPTGPSRASTRTSPRPPGRTGCS